MCYSSLKGAKETMNYKPNLCPVCGGVGEFRTYCSNACKQKAYRQRLEQEKRSLTNIVCAAIDEDFDEPDAILIYKLLNAVHSKKEAHAVDQALRIIINAYRAKVRLARMVKRGTQHAIAS